jgi:c-di-GMP phosphodiesterase
MLDFIILEGDPVQKRAMEKVASEVAPDWVVAFNSLPSCMSYLESSQHPFILITDIRLTSGSGASLISHFGQHKLLEGVIIHSGVDQDILEAISATAKLQGIPFVKTLAKPLDHNAFKETLTHALLGFKRRQIQKTVIDHPEFTRELLIEMMVQQNFEPYFQVQVDAYTYEVRGVEALARLHWQDSLIPPFVFLKAIEQYGLLDPFTDYMLEQSIIKLQQQRLEDITLSVNVEYLTLAQSDFSKKVLSILDRHRFPAHRLIIELTENQSHIDGVLLDNLIELRLKGIQLSVDDFGMGYSGLNEMLTLPFTELKMDKQSIDSIDDSPKCLKIVKSILSMANHLDLNTVAEGIETKQQASRMRKLGADLLQGYLFSQPVPALELNAVIHRLNAFRDVPLRSTA